MDRTKLKRGTMLLSAGLGVGGLATGCGINGIHGTVTDPCCDADAGVTTNCDPQCTGYGISVNQSDAGTDAGVVGFFLPDGGDVDSGTDAGMVFGVVVDGGTDAG
jgi:hypothetical protein